MDNTDRLIQLKRATERARTVKAAIERAKPYREALEQKIKALKESLLIEDQDVADLKGVNISTLLLTIRGKLGEHKEQQETEALAIRLKLSESEKELADVISRIDGLCEEHKSLSGSEAEYEQLYELRKQRLIREGNDNSRIAAELSENISRVKKQLTAADEALKAGEKTVKALDYVIENLKKAEEINDYGTPRGVLSEDKYDYLDMAAQYADKAKQFFDSFKAETAGVEAMQDSSANIGFLVADILFENVIPNWYTEGKIDRAKTRIAVIRSEIFCDVLQLRQLSGEAQSALNGLETRLDALVLGAAE